MTTGSRHLLVTATTICVLMIIGLHVTLGIGPGCVSNVMNIAVREGQTNTIMNLYIDPQNVTWKVIPTSDELSSYTIIGFGADPTLIGLYGVNQTGLIINYATTDGNPISTAGLYIGQCANNSNQTGAKLLVVSSGPLCFCTPLNSFASNVSCNVTYADSSLHPIYPIVTWKRSGAFQASYTLPRTKIARNVFSSESTIINNGGDPRDYTCELTFAPPTDIQFPFVATNAPELIVYCTIPECSRGTTVTEHPTTTRSPATTSPSTTGQHISTGSLTKKPTNTADVAGSINITLECASTYGTDLILWTFTPLRSSTNETIYISSGYQLLQTYQQKYALNATVNSSILIVRQLSNETEGNYNCYDGVESTSALLLAIPFPISVDPLFGPIAGGTSITIIGSITIGDISRYMYIHVGSTVTGVRNVYIGKDLSATSLSLLPIESLAFQLVAVTPSVTETSIGQPLPIIIEFSPTLFKLSINKMFVYLPNPEITSTYPNNFIVTGGTLLDVFGKSLSSVARPIIQLTVVITREAENITTSNSSTRVCTVPPGNDTYMQCPMPPLSLPDDFLEILNSQYRYKNSSTSRRRRSIGPFITNYHGLLSRLKRYVNVLTLTGPNGIDRADIYLGFILDGYKKYEEHLLDTKFIFYSPPEINSSDEVIQFDPNVDELVNVKGRYMSLGCRLIDYVVHIGNQICTNNDLQDNQLSCRPPKVKPSSTVNDTIYCDQYLSISITVGYKHYQYACLTYTDHSRRLTLIIGLTVGLGGFAILLIVGLLIVCIVRRRRKKVSEETDVYQNSGELELACRHNKSADHTESQEDLKIIHRKPNTMTMYIEPK